MPTLTTLSPLALAGGLAALGVVLYFLQRLRVRHQTLQVVTTLFWKEAVEESRARVFLKRFRHPWAWLLIFIAGGLLFLGAATPSFPDAAAPHRVILVDASARMARGEGFAQALVDLDQLLARLPEEGREVVLCAGIPSTLLRSGENRCLLSERLVGRGPEPCPSTVEQVLREQILQRDPARPLELYLVGEAPFESSALALLPEDVTVHRVAFELPDSRANRGISAVGATPAASGEWDRVDLFFRVQGLRDIGGELSVSSAGSPISQLPRVRVLPGEAGLAGVISDLPADGSVITLALRGGDDFPTDDRARIRLPLRRVLRVRVDASVLPQVEPVIAADPGLRLAEGEADVAIARARSEVPTLILSEEDGAAFRVMHPGGGAQSLWEDFLALGLEEIDVGPLADDSRQPIRLAVLPGNRRELRVWSRLFRRNSPFLQDRSFPLFVARGLRWLAEEDSRPTLAACGETVVGAKGRWTDEAGRSIDCGESDLIPPRAGDYRGEGGELLCVALSDRGSAGALSRAGEVEKGDSAKNQRPMRASSLVLLAAFALLLIEWFLFRGGRIP